MLTIDDKTVLHNINDIIAKEDIVMACKIDVSVSGREIALRIARELGASKSLIEEISFKDCFGPVIERCLQTDREMTIKILNRLATYSIHPVLKNYLHRGLLSCKNLPASVLTLLLSEEPDWTVFWLIVRHDNMPINLLREIAESKDPDKQREAKEALKRLGY